MGTGGMNKQGKCVAKSEAHRVLIVGEEPLYRAGMVGALSGIASLKCCGEVGDYEAVLRASSQLIPNIIVYVPGDIQLKDRNVIKQFRASFPCVAVLVLGGGGDIVFAERTLRDGARGFLLRDVSAKELVDGIVRIMEGELVVSPRLAPVLLSRVLSASPNSEASLVELSSREREVFELVGQGQCTRNVANMLHISIKTVETHQSRIKRKLALENSTELVHFATQWWITNERLDAN